MASREWSVTAEGFETGGNAMQASCHHRTGRVTLSACGGCYARATTALRMIADGAPASIADDVLAAMRSERKPTKTEAA